VAGAAAPFVMLGALLVVAAGLGARGGGTKGGSTRGLPSPTDPVSPAERPRTNRNPT
jgi:hypothetical protein